MKNYVYEVLERKENDIVVGDGSISFELLKRDGKRLDGAPAIAGRRVGCFYWNYDISTARLGGYTMQAFYPDMYEYNGRIYFVYGEVENLGGKYPLNRFSGRMRRNRKVNRSFTGLYGDKIHGAGYMMISKERLRTAALSSKLSLCSGPARILLNAGSIG